MKKFFACFTVSLLVLSINHISFGMDNINTPKEDKALIQKTKYNIEKIKKSKSTKKEENTSKEKANPLYPAKYTPEYISKIKGEYTCSAKSENVIVALDMLKDTNGEFSRTAILGNNLTKRPIKIEYRDLASVDKSYDTCDAVGWKGGRTLYILINKKHENAPSIALAALLAHEALHQDEFNSLAEETYAWTMEAAVWCELTELYDDFELGFDPLVQREITLKKLFEKGNYTNKYIRKTVLTNESYKDLPQYSPGFENL